MWEEAVAQRGEGGLICCFPWAWVSVPEAGGREAVHLKCLLKGESPQGSRRGLSTQTLAQMKALGCVFFKKLKDDRNLWS